MSAPPDGAWPRPRLLSIVIVGFNGRADVVRALDSIHQHPPATCTVEVIYVDNASTDGSASHVRAHYPATRVIQNRRNEGFQIATNRGLAAASGDYLLLMNPDAEVLRGSFDTLLSFLAARPRVGAVSPKCVFPGGEIQWTWGGFPALSMLLQWFFWEHPTVAALLRRPEHPRLPPDPDLTRDQDYAYGAFALVRRQVYEDVGPLDERYFLAGGDVDWGRRLHARGWTSYYVAEARVIHRAGTARSKRPIRTHIDWLAAHRRLLYTHEGLRSGLLCDLMFGIHLALLCRSAASSIFARALALITRRGGRSEGVVE